ncbi:MAG: hypothetical protein PHD87_07650, partial [Candidatus Cloacimonetes bacterium]|nr:hypothetical protein [Candidatus Cloacimonadota bacterium]
MTYPQKWLPTTKVIHIANDINGNNWGIRSIQELHCGNVGVFESGLCFGDFGSRLGKQLHREDIWR